MEEKMEAIRKVLGYTGWYPDGDIKAIKLELVLPREGEDWKEGFGIPKRTFGDIKIQAELRNGTLGHQEVLRLPKRVRRAWKEVFLREGWLARTRVLESYWIPVLRVIEDLAFTQGLKYGGRAMVWKWSKEPIPRLSLIHI